MAASDCPKQRNHRLCRLNFFFISWKSASERVVGGVVARGASYRSFSPNLSPVSSGRLCVASPALVTFFVYIARARVFLSSSSSSSSSFSSSFSSSSSTFFFLSYLPLATQVSPHPLPSPSSSFPLGFQLTLIPSLLAASKFTLPPSSLPSPP